MKLINSLRHLINNLDYKVIYGKINDIDINKVVYDSRKVTEGDLFICLNGARFDSHSEILNIIDNGAKVIIVEENNQYIKDINYLKDIIVLSVKNTRIALAVISNNYFNNPSKKLKIIGVTGTKGKTTTSFMIRNILKESGYKTGLIGTIGIFYNDEYVYTENTTPESYILHEYFAKMLDENIEYVVMEVSSQSLKYHRVYGINFDYAVWTNIKPEHIGENEHTDYNDYLNSKLLIFKQTKNAVINSDTSNYNDIIKICNENNVNYFEKKFNRTFNLLIPGNYNLENASLAYEIGKAIGIDENIIINALEKTIVPGRCELVYESDEYKVIVDFSYENNGAIKFLNTIKELNPKRIVTVFGCGGNRSKDRRYGMGEVTGQLADFIILTADNSRYEKTIDIISDIETTLKKYKKINDLNNGYIIIEDRRKAIEYAIHNHKKGDVICVMGKGHEPFMEFEGKKVNFKDKDIILDIINNYCN